MNIDKFEYWAKRQGMSCVRSKVKWHNEMYTNKDTEQAYNYWVSATSSDVQELYEEQVELEMIYRSLNVTNNYFIEACTNILDTSYKGKGELGWLFQYSDRTEKDDAFVLERFESFKSMCKKSLSYLAKYTNLSDFAVWKTREDYTKSKAIIESAVVGVSSPGYSGYGLESILKSKVGTLVMQSRVILKGFEHKFTDKIIELAIELSEKETHESD